MKRGSLAALVLVAFGAVSGFVGHQLNRHPRIQSVITKAALEVDEEGTRYLSRFGFSCGVEAWSVKTMSDSAASQVNLTPKLTNIPALIAKTGSSGHRVDPPQVYHLSGAHLIEYKVEPDSDIHLVLQSTLANHPTMIAEIPNPTCAGASRVLSQITAARAAFVQQIGPPQTYFVKVDDRISISGVAFVDFAHGQTGADPNQIELHPVISFQKLK